MEGYRFKAKSLAEAQTVIAGIRKCVQEELGRLYAGWLGDACAEACDMISLGRMERGERPLMEVAKDIVLARVKEAGALALPSPMNIRVVLRVFQKGKYCYVQCEPAGTALFQAIAKAKGVEDFCLSPAEEREGGSERRMVWQAVFSAYRDGGMEPFLCDLTPALDVGGNAIAFPSVPARVEALARRSAMEDYLAVVSRQAAIPPQDLLRRIDEALAYVLSPAGKLAMDVKRGQLLRILIDLDAHPELVYGDAAAPSADAKAQKPDAALLDGSQMTPIDTAAASDSMEAGGAADETHAAGGMAPNDGNAALGEQPQPLGCPAAADGDAGSGADPAPQTP